MKKHTKYKIDLSNLSGHEKYLMEHKIVSVIDDPRSWRQFGYTFEQMPNKTPDKEVNLIIYAKPNKEIKKICGFDGLSCADHGKKLRFIYINLEKWRDGCDKSGLSKDLYRTYIINHEMAHILDRHHLKLKDFKPGEKVAVRIPQTLLGIGHCEPNPYPLDYEDF